MRPKHKRRLHMIDFRSGGYHEHTLCNKDLRDVKWTAGYLNERKQTITCKMCLRVMANEGITI